MTLFDLFRRQDRSPSLSEIQGNLAYLQQINESMDTTLTQLQTDIAALTAAATAYSAAAAAVSPTPPIDYTAEDEAVTSVTSVLTAATAALTPAAAPAPAS